MADKDIIRLYDGPKNRCEGLGFNEKRTPLTPESDPSNYPKCTEVLEYLGFESLSEEMDSYLLDASALKYLVEVHYQEGEIGNHSTNKEEEVLFNGYVMISKEMENSNVDGSFPGGSVKGGIWKTVPKDEGFEEGGLAKLIFADDDKVSRIESIIRGYRKREKAKKKEHTRLMIASHQGEKKNTYTGGGPC